MFDSESNQLDSIGLDTKTYGPATQIAHSTYANDMIFGLLTPSHVLMYRVRLPDYEKSQKSVNITQEWANELPKESAFDQLVLTRQKGKLRFSALDSANNTLVSYTRDGKEESRIDVGRHEVTKMVSL